MTFEYEYTDTFGGEANYSWKRSGKVEMPDLTHYGYDGLRGYFKANRTFNRELVKKVKAELGLTGLRCDRSIVGYTIELRPRGSNTIIFINFCD